MMRCLLLALCLIAASIGAQAQTVALGPSPIQRFVDSNGNALSGGKVFTYSAGTTTKLATYTDSGGLTQQTNPIILNSRGEPQNSLGNSVGIWLGTSAYKFVLAPSTDTDPPTNAIWTLDGVASVITLGTTALMPGNTVTTVHGLSLIDGSSLAGTSSINITGAATLSGATTINAQTMINRNASAAPNLGFNFQLTGTDATANTLSALAFGNSDIFVGLRANGTNAAPTAPGLGNPIVSYMSGGYNGSGYIIGTGGIEVDAAENWSAGVMGTSLAILTQPIGTAPPGTPARYRVGVRAALMVYDAAGVLPTGGDTGGGTVNAAVGYYTNGTAGIAACGPIVTAGASITIKGGLVTAFTGC